MRTGAVIACVAVTAGLGCGGVYDEVAPPERRIVEAEVRPDFVRAGETMKRVDAFIDVQAERTFVTSIDLQAGIDVVRFDTEQPCSELTPPTFDDREAFQVCLTLSVAGSVEQGSRVAKFELRADNELVISEATFFVLPEL